MTAHNLDDLRSGRDFKPLVAKGTMTSKVIGAVQERFFYRRSAGPGWEFVGDAGHHQEPILEWGVPEVLWQVKQLVEAIRPVEVPTSISTGACATLPRCHAPIWERKGPGQNRPFRSFRLN